MKWNLTNLIKRKKPGLADCPDAAKCLELLYAIVDGQATAAEKLEFEKKMEECISCYNRFQLEMAIKHAVQASSAPLSVPVELVDSIRLQTVDGTG